MPTIGEILYGVGADTSRLRAAVGDIQKFSSSMNNAAEQVVAASEKASQALNQQAAAAKKVTEEHSVFADGMRNLARAAALTSGPLSGLAFRITLLSELLSKGTLNTALFVAGAAGAAFAFYRLGEAAVATEFHLTEIRNSLLALHGSQMQMQLDMNFVIATADKFGLKFQDVAHAFTQLDIAARNTKLQGQGVRDMFTEIMSVAGTLSMSQERLAGTLNFVERMLSLGIVQWRNLREAARDIPNIMELVSQAIGVKGPIAIEKFLKLGTTMSDVLLPKIIHAWAQAFGVDATKPIDNIVAAHNRLQNAQFRFSDALNQSVGFSSAAIRTYTALAALLDTLSRNMETVVKVAGIAAGALAGLGSAYVAQGLIAVGGAVYGIVKAVAALDLAVIASPGGMLLKLLATIAGAVAAYYVLDGAIAKVSTGLITSTPAIADYVAAWDKFKTGFSSDTTRLMSQATEEISHWKAQIEGATLAVADAQAAVDKWNRATPQGSEQLAAANVKLQQAQTALAGYKKGLEDATAGVASLNRVLNEQKKIESAVPGIPGGENQALARMKNAYDKLNEAVREYEDQLAATREGTFAEQQAKMLDGVAKKMQDMRIMLQDAGYEWDRFTKHFVDAKLDLKFQQLGQDMLALAQIKLFDKNFVQGWQLAEDAIRGLTKGALDAMIDELNKGKLSWKDFGQTMTSVLAAIEKQILEMATVNPLLMALFGGGPTGKPLPTFTLSGGGTQPGGLFGALLSALSPGANPGTGPGAGSTSAGYIQHSGGMGRMGMFPSSIFAGAPRLHSGLAGDEYPAIMQRGEQVIPKGQSGPGNVIVNVQHPPGTVAQATRNNAQGASTYDIVISHIRQGIKRGDLDIGFGSRYGVRPQPVLR